jgi:hypothetical protein
MYGTMDDAGEKMFMRWSLKGVEGERQHALDNKDKLGEPPDDLM